MASSPASIAVTPETPLLAIRMEGPALRTNATPFGSSTLIVSPTETTIDCNNDRDLQQQVTKYKGKRQGKPSSQTNKRGKVRGFALHMWIEPYNRVVHTRAMSCIHCSVHYIICIFGVFRICAASSRYPSHSAYRTGLIQRH